MAAKAVAFARGLNPVSTLPGRDTASAGALNRSSNCAARASERTRRSISKNRFRLHASRLHVPARTSSPSRTNALACSIVGYSRIRTPASRSLAWWNCCAAAHAQAGRPLDPADHPAIGDVGIDDVEGLASAIEGPSDLVGDRTVFPRRVVQNDRGDLSVVDLGKQAVELLPRELTPEPAEARDEDELKLRDDGSGHAEEKVVKPAVLEVVFDPGAADPAGAPVHEHDLAVVYVAQAGEVPLQGAVGP